MSKFAKTLQHFIQDESGATMVEYGIMLALIAVVAVGAVRIIGTNATTSFTNSAAALQ
jgi:pilus assembly protein Flp/PilA